MTAGGVIAFEDLERLGRRLREAGQRIVFTNGCFDLLHVGHVRLLRQARALGDILVVGVNSDSSVRLLGKGADRPLNSEQDRAELVAALRSVDYAVIFSHPTPVEAIERLRPQIHVKGGDYTAAELPEAEAVRRAGGRIEIIPLVPGRSTSLLATRLKESVES